jgi:hypothetical protein
MRRYPQFRSSPSLVAPMPSVGSAGSPPPATQTVVRRRRGQLSASPGTADTLVSVGTSVGGSGTTIEANLGTVQAIGYQATIAAGGLPSYVSNAELYLDIGSGLSMRLGGPRIPMWNTSGRPAAPLDGIYGLNTDTNTIEAWNGTTWV